MDFLSAKIFIINALDGLSPALTYHGKHHTLDVFAVAERLCAAEKVSEKKTIIVLTAALLHDIGFLRQHKDHEEHSCRIAEEWLPKFGYTEGAIKEICGLIRATKIPQSPKTPLEEILCDADLDYLGRDDFYAIGATLFQEMKSLKMIETEAEWHDMQVHFLQNHHYFTAISRRERMPIQEKHLAELIKSNQTNP